MANVTNYLGGATGDPSELRRRVALQAVRGIPAAEADFFDYRSHGGEVTAEATRIPRMIVTPGGEQAKDLDGKLLSVLEPESLGDLDPTNRMVICALMNLFGFYDYASSTPAAGVEQWLFSKRGATSAAKWLTLLEDNDINPRERHKDVKVSGITIAASAGGSLSVTVQRVGGEHDLHGAVVQTEGGKAALSITGITRTGTTATATTAAPHGLATNDVVSVSGADQADYNLNTPVTVTGASTYTYTVDVGAVTPATGTIVYATSGLAVTSITRTGAVATATTDAAHGLTSNDTVRISGAVETEYNGDVVVTVTGADTFTYPVSGTPTSPATGTILYESLADALPVFSLTSPLNVADDDVDGDLYVRFDSVTALGVWTVSGKVGAAAVYSSTFTAKAGNDSAGNPIFTRFKNESGAFPGIFAETPKMYVPAGIRPGATYRVPKRRAARWTQELETDRPIGSVSLDFLVAATEGGEPESIRIEGGFTAVIAKTAESTPDTPGRQGSLTDERGPFTCTITPTRRISDPRFQRVMRLGTTVSAVIDMRTETMIGATAYPYRGVILAPAVVPSGRLYGAGAGATNRDESPALVAGIPEAPFTYDGITTSAPVAFVLQNDVTTADMGVA